MVSPISCFFVAAYSTFQVGRTHLLATYRLEIIDTRSKAIHSLINFSTSAVHHYTACELYPASPCYLSVHHLIASLYWD